MNEMKLRSSSWLGAVALFLVTTGCVGDTAVPVTVVPDSSVPDTSVGKDSSTDASDASVADTSAVDTGADAGPNIKGISGLVLWLDATVGVTAPQNNVSKWADQSGNGNDAVQATSNVQPTLVAQGINGKPAVRFTTVQNAGSSPFVRLAIPDAMNLRMGTGDFYMTSVVQWENKNGGSLGCIISKQSGTNPFAGIAYYMNFPMAGKVGGQLDANTNVNSTLANLNDGMPRQYGFLRTSGNASVRVNGASDGTSPGTNVNSDAMGVPLSIGGIDGANGLHPLVGMIAEIIIVNGPITVQNINLIEGYLKNKYGL